MKQVSKPSDLLLHLQDMGINEYDSVIVGLEGSVFGGEFNVISITHVSGMDDVEVTIDANEAHERVTHHAFVIGVYNDLFEFADRNQLVDRVDNMGGKPVLESAMVDFEKQTWWSSMCDGECCGPNNQTSFALPVINENDEDDDDDESFELPEELRDAIYKAFIG